VKIRFKKGKKRLFLSIFISLILCIVVTMLVVSTILYVNFEGIALEQVYSADMESLMQTSESVRNMADTALTLSNQIYNDLSVAKLLYYSNPEISDIRTASDQLTNYRLSLSFIDSVYVYNGKSETVYINASSDRNTYRDTIQAEKTFDDKDCIGILHNFKSYKKYIPIPRKLVVNAQEGIVKYYYTFLLYDAFSGNSLDSAVVVNISEDWIHNVIANSPDNSTSETFIINSTGELVSNSKKYPMQENISSRSYIGEILRNSNAKGYFIDDVDGQRSLITFTAPDKVGWRYIRVTPCDTLFGRINAMKRMTIAIGLGILLFGLLIALLISRRLYVPINGILMNLKKLEDERDNDFELIKQGVLKDIVLGHAMENRSGLLGRLKSLDIKVDLDGSFRLVLIKIDNYKDFYQNFGAEDRSLLRFAIMNISVELLSKEYRTEAVDMGEGNILILMNSDRLSGAVAEGTAAGSAADLAAGASVGAFAAVPSASGTEPVLAGDKAPGTAAAQEQEAGTPQEARRAEDGDSFAELMNSIKEAVFNCIKISVTITVSGTENSIEGINTLYRQAVEASLHRLFYGHGALIFAEKIAGLSEKGYIYPTNKEKQMVDALMSQKSADAKRIFDEIIYDASEYPFSVMNLALSRLIFTVNNTVNTIRGNNPAMADFDKSLPAMMVNDAEVIEEISAQFYGLFESLCDKLDERKNTKHEELIASIHSIIQKEFSSPSLSIESIADRLEISPTYMCRLYKQYTMTTILDKIVEVRMERAKALLQKTSFSIAEISEETGFTNSSYFYRAFKKYNGTTPNDYRQAVNAVQ
jgi:AraC-like DNA-binding protein